MNIFKARILTILFAALLVNQTQAGPVRWFLSTCNGVYETLTHAPGAWVSNIPVREYRDWRKEQKRRIGVELPIWTRVKDVAQIFRDVQTEFEQDPALGVAAIFQNRDILPEDGCMHVIGPGKNFYEWAVPLLGRRDVKIVINESDSDVLEILRNPDKLRAEIWVPLNENNPRLIEGKTVKSFEDFQQAFDRQVIIVPSVEKEFLEPDDPAVFPRVTEKTPVPKGDLVVAMNPHQGNSSVETFFMGLFGDMSAGGTRYWARAKPGTVYWVLTERAPPPTRFFINIETGVAGRPISPFLARHFRERTRNLVARMNPPENFFPANDEPSKFRGIDLGQIYIGIEPPEELAKELRPPTPKFLRRKKAR